MHLGDVCVLGMRVSSWAWDVFVWEACAPWCMLLGTQTHALGLCMLGRNACVGDVHTLIKMGCARLESACSAVTKFVLLVAHS